MTTPDDDAWVMEDPTLCLVCGREACEDHLPPAAPATADPAVVRLALAIDAERIRRQARRAIDAEERPPLVVPALETLTARLARPAPCTDWRIQGWQGRHHRVMLAAQYKAGKTTLRDNYIRSKVDGDPFLASAAVTPIAGGLVLVDAEMGTAQLDAWLRAQQIHATDRVWTAALRGNVGSFNLLDPDIRRQWVTRLREVHADDFVLDCLRPVLDALGLDEQREAGRFLVALDDMLLEAGVSEALVIHHMGHGTERSRGDSRIRDWPDVEWRLIRRDDDPSSPRYITAYGRDVEIAESRLSFDPETRHLTLAGGSRHDERARAALAAVVEVLLTTGELSGRALKEALEDSDHGRNAIEAAIRLGIRQKDLTKRTGPRNARLYRLAASGD